MSPHTAAITIVLVGLTAAPVAAEPAVWISYETGPAYVAQNDGRYGADGTAYDAAEVGQQANLARGERAQVELALGRHRVVALYAPLRLDTRVRLQAPLVFRDTTFPATAVVDHRYRFDGYRASYLYQVIDGTLGVELGGTLQVRDADVAFTSVDGARHASQTDIGVVPALKARLTYAPGALWAQLELDGSSTFGLVGDTSGALYDVALGVGYPLGAHVDGYADLRLVGGGAEVPDQAIDNWANFVSASLGLRVRIGG